jgi:hypothetical protein
MLVVYEFLAIPHPQLVIDAPWEMKALYTSKTIDNSIIASA